jgi:predicted ATPase
LWRAKACILSRAGRQRQEEAETCFRQALACAEEQQSKMLALRTATSLAESWASRGLRSEAHALLAPRYHSFSEGFDTPDLKQAKRLMDVLQ